MADTYEHNPADHEDPVSGLTWLVGFLGAVVLVVVLLGVTALYYNAKAQEVQGKVISQEPAEVQALRRQQEELLSGPPRWIEHQEQDRTVETLIIPIERAMELIVEEANAGDLSSAHTTGETP